MIMKKLFVILSLMVCIFTFGACSKGGIDNNMSNDNNNTQQEQIEPISSLIGTWKETGDKTDLYWYEAIVTDNSIELFYCDLNDSRDLYWNGSFENPENPVLVWTYKSYNRDLTPGSLEYRIFNYSNGEMWLDYIDGEPRPVGYGDFIYLTKIS